MVLRKDANEDVCRSQEKPRGVKGFPGANDDQKSTRRVPGSLFEGKESRRTLQDEEGSGKASSPGRVLQTQEGSIEPTAAICASTACQSQPEQRSTAAPRKPSCLSAYNARLASAKGNRFTSVRMGICAATFRNRSPSSRVLFATLWMTRS